MAARFFFKTNVFVLIYINLSVCVCQGEKECVRFKTDTDTVYAEPNSEITVNFTIEQLCHPKTVVVNFISAVVQRETIPHAQICLFAYNNGSCLNGNCGCNPGGFSVSRTVGGVGRERWLISGYGNRVDKLFELAVDIVVKETTTSDMSLGFQFPLGIFLSVVIPLVIIIVILTVFVFKRRHVSGQVNPRPVEVEMVPLYSRTNPDVHHYLGLPPNRHAPTDDESDYLEVIDSESRPESDIYQVPRELSSPSNAPADYLHPVAAAQERSLSPSNAPDDYLHPVTSAQERP